MKFGQSIEYNVQNILPQKSSIKWGSWTSNRSLLLTLFRMGGWGGNKKAPLPFFSLSLRN